MTPAELAADLRDRIQALTSRAHVPFSHRPVATLFLLNDGLLVPGVRVESATFSLTLPAIVNGYTTCVSLQRAQDIVAIACNRPFRTEDEAYLQHLPALSLTTFSNDVLMATSPASNGANDGEVHSIETAVTLPDPIGYADVSASRDDERFSRLDGTPASDPLDTHLGVRLARSVAEHAYVPASNFRVGTIIEGRSGTLYPGVNVEHPDWTRILCAERNAAGTARSYGESSVRQIFLTCLDDPSGTPCGACRQVLAELAPEAALWMDRHDSAAEESSPEALLPGFFRGNALLQP